MMTITVLMKIESSMSFTSQSDIFTSYYETGSARRLIKQEEKDMTEAWSSDIYEAYEEYKENNEEE